MAVWFETGLIADVADVDATHVDDALAMWVISAARDLAWSHAKVLWRLRQDPSLADAYGEMLARLVELSAAASWCSSRHMCAAARARSAASTRASVASIMARSVSEPPEPPRVTA